MVVSLFDISLNIKVMKDLLTCYSILETKLLPGCHAEEISQPYFVYGIPQKYGAVIVTVHNNKSQKIS